MSRLNSSKSSCQEQKNDGIKLNKMSDFKEEEFNSHMLDIVGLIFDFISDFRHFPQKWVLWVLWVRSLRRQSPSDLESGFRSLGTDFKRSPWVVTMVPEAPSSFLLLVAMPGAREPLVASLLLDRAQVKKQKTLKQQSRANQTLFAGIVSFVTLDVAMGELLSSPLQDRLENILFH